MRHPVLVVKFTGRRLVVALLDDIESELHGICSALYLHVLADNAAGLAFYDSYVWRESE